VDLQSNTTGLSPIVRALGEADLGLLFQNDQAETMFSMDAVATGVTGYKQLMLPQGTSLSYLLKEKLISELHSIMIKRK